MTFTQMHEQLRVELLRRVQRGTASISLLSRQTGFGKSHLSNFLHCRRQLSLQGLDRILESMHMAVEDLSALSARHNRQPGEEAADSVPVVSHAVALFEPHIRGGAVETMLSVPRRALESLKSRPAENRRYWQRFVAIRISPASALPMEPLILPDTLAVIDRHYNSLIPYRANRPNLYAVRNGAHLLLRYADSMSMRLVLRPLSMGFPIDLIEIGPESSLAEFIAGWVVLTVNEV